MVSFYEPRASPGSWFKLGEVLWRGDLEYEGGESVCEEGIFRNLDFCRALVQVWRMGR